VRFHSAIQAGVSTGVITGVIRGVVTFEVILSTQTHILRPIFAVVVVLLVCIHNIGTKPSTDNNNI
jgi:hypothetical protein